MSDTPLLLLVTTSSGQIWFGADGDGGISRQVVSLSGARRVIPGSVDVGPMQWPRDRSDDEIVARFVEGGDVADVCTLGPPLGDLQIHDASLVIPLPGNVTYGTVEQFHIERQRQLGCTCEYRGRAVVDAASQPMIIRVDGHGCPAHREATLQLTRSTAEARRAEQAARRRLRWAWLPWSGTSRQQARHDYDVARTRGHGGFLFHEPLACPDD